VFVLVEAKLEEVVHESTGLRVAERAHEMQIPGQRVGSSFAVHGRAVQKCGVNGAVFPINLQRDYAVWSLIKATFRPTDFN
jgi:hypothetical protein